ncbi:MAG TPA: TetR/AcrR family transcriptional regulator [Hyphomonas sp.]|nr:hypothetical protein [Hyphomonas sp.]HRJ00881.1 TetR/AcrR family transcriptional regulator [Hyphomonas sp.]HRK66080.1 TetR/AcrR family transcriptional regulator [Hyphomonas sp.]
MAGRPRIFDRDTALDAFVDVFWTHGYAGADVDKLQEAAGILRGSFYRAFRDKPSAFKEAFDRYLGHVLMPRLGMLERSDAEALPEFLRVVGGFVASQGDRGCFFSETLLNVSDLDGQVRPAVMKARSLLKRKLKRLARGDAGLANFVFASALGLHGLARSGATKSEIRQAANEAAETIAMRLA